MGFLKSITKERKRVKCAYFRVITSTVDCVEDALCGHKAWEMVKNWRWRMNNLLRRFKCE